MCIPNQSHVLQESVKDALSSHGLVEIGQMRAWLVAFYFIILQDSAVIKISDTIIISVATNGINATYEWRLTGVHDYP